MLLLLHEYWIDTVLQAVPYRDPTSPLHAFGTSPLPFLKFAISTEEKYLNGEDAIQVFIRTFLASWVKQLDSPCPIT